MAIPGEELRLRFDFRGDQFDRVTVEALAGRFIRIVEATVAVPERALGRIDILSAAERETILRGWNDTAHPVEQATLPELFAAQAGQTARCHCGRIRE